MIVSGPETPAARTEIEQFTAGLVHDFNNLLTGILGNLELMQSRAQRNGNRDFDHYLEAARHSGARAALFTQRLLAFSGHTAQEPVPVDLNALIRDMAEPMRAEGLLFTAELADDTGKIRCDPLQAELALHELLSNAAEATQAGGRIVLRSRAAAGQVIVSVADDGSGMAPDILRRATEPFFSTRSNGAGKGLGLAIVARFAQRHGGTLQLTSAPGQGTTARLKLPVA